MDNTGFPEAEFFATGMGERITLIEHSRTGFTTARNSTSSGSSPG